MTRTATVTFLFALAMLLAPTAFADPPTRDVFDLTGEADYAAGELCPFPVHVETTGDLVVTDFYKDGMLVREIQTAPSLRETYTNVQTGESFSSVIVGPAFLEFNPDGSLASFTGTGPWAFYYNPNNLTEPGLFITEGRFSFVFDEEGNLAAVNFAGGHRVDVCAVLSP